jgi:hypothetical protein
VQQRWGAHLSSKPSPVRVGLRNETFQRCQHIPAWRHWHLLCPKQTDQNGLITLMVAMVWCGLLVAVFVH